MTKTPTLTGRHIGEANLATTVLLDALLAGAEVSSAGWITLNAVASGGLVGSGPLRRQLWARLEAAGTSAAEVLDELESAGLLEITTGAGGDPGTTTVALTPAGDSLFLRLRDLVTRTTVQIYDGIPDADLATTRRVLAEVTRRAEERTLDLATQGPA